MAEPRDDRTDLGQVLADAREEAAVLRSHGHGTQAKSIETLADRVTESMRGYLTTLSESGAMLRSGWSAPRLRARFVEWEAQGMAMLDAKGKRRYRISRNEMVTRVFGSVGVVLLVCWEKT